MKQMKTQGASDAMQMAHYKLTIIIIITSQTQAGITRVTFSVLPVWSEKFSQHLWKTLYKPKMTISIQCINMRNHGFTENTYYLLFVDFFDATHVSL